MPRRNATQSPKKTELRPLRSADVDLDLSEPVPTLPSLPSSSPPSPLSIRASRNVARTNHWKNNPYAAGLVEPTWSDEVTRGYMFDVDEESDINANGPNRTCCEDAGSENMDPTCGCLYVSGIVCGRLGFKRLGNMIILKERMVDVESSSLSNHEDLANNTDGSGDRRQETEIVYIIGPYWPMLFFVTYPLIISVSLFTASRVVFAEGGVSPILALVWTALTSGLCYSLFQVSFRNPGILKKHTSPPDGASSSSWRWDDRVQSYAPRRAFYDPDCAVVVEDFDHTCPWTGTAIGSRNMSAFQAFVSLVFICLIMDIILLTSTAVI